jgi:hypothetical protein
MRGWAQVTAQILEQAETGGVWVTPRQPRLAWSKTAQTRLRQLRSPRSRPITLALRWVSPKVRSMRLVWRIRASARAGTAASW